MSRETSTFRSGQPVPIESFNGHIREVERLRGMVKASTQRALPVNSPKNV